MNLTLSSNHCLHSTLSKDPGLRWIVEGPSLPACGLGLEQTDTMRFYPTGMGFRDFFLKERKPLTAVDQLCMDPESTMMHSPGFKLKCSMFSDRHTTTQVNASNTHDQSH